MLELNAALLAGATEPEATFDAGPMGCGEIVIELKFRLRDLPAGARLIVHGTDPGLPEDLPAWCRMTGHTLVWARPPYYLIQRRDP
ncbi:MAG: sulfurtransferase TusA family protein [Deltaproteobacteria bacterium]|nr:sulfurtransferase TusA family protein [SAR202 cluster bacterium]MBM4247654.1 sulfurtransferase TusA family protein [Deltaproteobacteria bacterium]